MFHLYKGRKKKHLRITTELILLRLIITLAVSSVGTIWAVYMSFNLGLDESSVGFLTSSLYCVAFLSAFLTIPILERFNENKILVISLFLLSLSYFFIPLFNNFFYFLFFAVLISIVGVFRVDSFDILFRDNSKKKNLNQDEGLMYSIMGLGWIIGPLMGLFFLNIFIELEYIFYLTSILFLCATVFFMRLKVKVVPKNFLLLDRNILKNIKSFLLNKKLRIPFLMSSGVYMWWYFVLIYMPLFLLNNGLDENFLGLFFAFIFMPLIFMDYLIGRLSQKYGFKIFFKLGFLILFLVCISLFYVDNYYLMIILIIIGSFAISFAESIQDTFFFSKVKREEEEKFYPIYATSEFFGAFIGNLTIAVLLLFFPYNYSFLFVGSFLLFLAYLSTKIKE